MGFDDHLMWHPDPVILTGRELVDRMPAHEPWRENNTGPLLPAIRDPGEINYMRPDSHLSRAANPALLGTDTRPAGWYHRWTEDEKRGYLGGKTVRETEALCTARVSEAAKSAAIIAAISKPVASAPSLPLTPERAKVAEECQKLIRELEAKSPPKISVQIKPIAVNPETRAKLNALAAKYVQPGITPDLDDSVARIEAENQMAEKLMAFMAQERKKKTSEVDLAPIVSRKGLETVFESAGKSHFSFVQGKGFHVTTQVPGLKQGVPVSLHDYLVGDSFEDE